MIQFLNTLLAGIIGFLNSFLPTSPFDGLLQSSEGLRLGLAWANWFFPIGDCLVIFGLVLGMLVVWIVVRLSLGKLDDIAKRLI